MKGGLKMFFAPAIRRDSSFLPAGPDLGFERFMGDALRGFGGMAMDEDDKSWTLSLDVPGVAKENLGVTIVRSTVNVETQGETKRRYKFSYELPGEIDAEASQASLEHGVLTLRLAKAEVRQRRQIAIT
jgi:HSP20 family protein